MRTRAIYLVMNLSFSGRWVAAETVWSQQLNARLRLLSDIVRVPWRLLTSQRVTDRCSYSSEGLWEKNILYPKIGSTKTLKWDNLGMIEEEKNVSGLRTEIVLTSQSTRLESCRSSPIDCPVREYMYWLT